MKGMLSGGMLLARSLERRGGLVFSCFSGCLWLWGVWKEIKEWETIASHVSFVLGNGRRLSFLKDVWCGEVALCETFPCLFELVANKEILAADVWEDGAWPPCFFRPFNDWKRFKISSMLFMLRECFLIKKT